MLIHSVIGFLVSAHGERSYLIKFSSPLKAIVPREGGQTAQSSTTCTLGNSHKDCSLSGTVTPKS